MLNILVLAGFIAVAQSSVIKAPHVITYTGDVISSDGPLPAPRTMEPIGRPVYTHTPQITEHRKKQKNVHTKYNVPVLNAVNRKKVVQDVTHQYVAKPYAVPRPYDVPYPVAVPYSVPVYHHEVEYKPIEVVRHHKHTKRVQHFPLVKTADVFHQSAIHHHQVHHVAQPVVAPVVQYAARPANIVFQVAPAAAVPE